MMNVLIDTHIFLWLIYESDKINPKIQSVIDKSTVYVSIVTLWEIAIKQSIGKLKYPHTPSQMQSNLGCQLLSLDTSHIDEYKKWSGIVTKDPFDRLLYTQAKTEGMEFLTVDSKISPK
jgi:PIN domain nuclease of toxin-antitoxin system